MTNRMTKDPDAVLDYTTDWERWLRGDTIDALEVVVAPDGVTVEADEHDDTTATAWISGGTLGEDYGVTFRITTVGGRTDDRTITLLVRDR